MVKTTLQRTLNKFYPTYYGWTTTVSVPRIIYQLIWSGSKRLSNNRHHRKLLYQVNLITNKALDVENDEVLNGIIKDLEGEGYNTNDWHEQIDIDDKSSNATYVYMLEVRNW